MATKHFNDIDGNQVLCSRVNAGSLERGDVAWNEDGNLCYWIKDVHRLDTGHVILKLDQAPWNVRLRTNTPVWRETGARAGGGMG